MGWGTFFSRFYKPKPNIKTEPQVEPIRIRALKIAISQIGQEEKPRGSNWGRPVQDYLASVGINFPASWCMAFVYWCFEKAANGAINPMYKTGGVLLQYQKRKQFAVKEPQAGDVFIMNFGGGLGHTGFIEKVFEGRIHTIEGNTNNDGSRNGFAVERKIRKLSDKKIIAFLRFV